LAAAAAVVKAKAASGCLGLFLRRCETAKAMLGLSGASLFVRDVDRLLAAPSPQIFSAPTRLVA
jgi:hypothetical protein